MKYLVAVQPLLSSFLAGCSGFSEQVPDNPPNEILRDCSAKLRRTVTETGVITQLEALDNCHPPDRIPQVQPDLTHAITKFRSALAQAAIDRRRV